MRWNSGAWHWLAADGDAFHEVTIKPVEWSKSWKGHSNKIGVFRHRIIDGDRLLSRMCVYKTAKIFVIFAILLDRPTYSDCISGCKDNI